MTICSRSSAMLASSEESLSDRPLDISTEEDEEEDDIKVDMNTLHLTRPHTRIDYYHFLVPHLTQITNSSFYWGKMDRYMVISIIIITDNVTV